ncbi:MAG: S-layer homology domain-containing protein [Clostridiaceae bacterium]|nr:S-layer homology domain-containing protein [Clostridiaceae bacterium]
MNPKNDYLRDCLGITAWHKAGYTGSRGLTASGEDFTTASPYAHEYLSYAAFKEVAPDREVIYVPYDDFDALIEVSQKADTIFVSRSNYSFPKESREKIDGGIDSCTTMFMSAGNHDDDKYNLYLKADHIYGVGAAELIASKMVNGVPTKNATYTLMSKAYSSITEYIDFSCLTNWKLISGNREDTFTGTSCACPVLCGMAALINDMAIHKTGASLPDSGMIQALKDISVDMNTEGHDSKTGWGIPILPPPDQFDIFKYQEAKMLDFKDKDSISVWALDAVEYCANLGIVRGDSENTFRPQDPVTREELCVIIKRMMDLE